MAYKGIDVSYSNGIVNWDKVKKAGIEFAIIRAGFGGDNVKQDDKQAEKNMLECERLHIPYGLYLYSYALRREQAGSEAAHVLRLAKGRKVSLGIWYDMEDGDGYKKKHGLDVRREGQMLTDCCEIFCNEVKEKGYEAGIYASLDYFKNILVRERLRQFPFWVAHWGAKEPGIDCRIWQYTSDGVVDGAGRHTDMDYYYGELPA